MSNPRDFPLYRNQTALMQGILERASRGYTWWDSGTCPIPKAIRFVEKMDQKHQVLDARSTRSLHRKQGKIVATLLLHPEGSDIHWVILATGKLKDENLKDAVNKRQTQIAFKFYRCGIESGKWTWRLSSEKEKEWLNDANSYGQKFSANELNNLLRIIQNLPMFAGVRRDALKIIAEAKKAWKFKHKTLEGVHWPDRLPSMRKIQAYDDPPKTLGFIVDQYQANLKANSEIQNG